MEDVSAQISGLSNTGKRQFISRLKSEFRNSPLASNVVLGFILAGLEKLLEMDFACPCSPRWNAVFALAYFVVPAIVAAVLMVFIHGCKRETCKELENIACFILAPIIVWLILVFLDGQYFACLMTNWAGRFVIIDKAAPQTWCEPEGNKTLSMERMSQTQHYYFVSQFTGLLILIFFTIILGAYICLRKRKCPEEPAQQEEMNPMRSMVAI